MASRWVAIWAQLTNLLQWQAPALYSLIYISDTDVTPWFTLTYMQFPHQMIYCLSTRFRDDYQCYFLLLNVSILFTIIVVIINIKFDDLTIKFSIFKVVKINTNLHTPSRCKTDIPKMTLMIKNLSVEFVNICFTLISFTSLMKKVCHMFLSAKCITNQ